MNYLYLTREAYVAPPAIGGKALKILVLDGNVERSNAIQLKGSGYHMRVLRTQEAVKQHFATPERWDLALHSCFLGDWNADMKELAAPLVEAFKLGRIRGVICTSTITTDSKKFMEALREGGVPCRYVPYDYANPSHHQTVTL